MTDTFKVTVKGQEIELYVKSPSFKDNREASKIYNRVFKDAISSGSIVRARLDEVMKEQGLWSDAKELEYKTIQKQILEKEKILAKGGISLEAAKTQAMEMRELRDSLRVLISNRTTLDSHTAEGQADNAKFNYLVSACVVYKDTDKPYFSGYEDYINRGIEPAAIIGAQKLANMLYGLDNDFEQNLPENKFLKKYKFVDSDLRLINKDGKLIDADGRLVDENGFYIDDKGNRVDIDGAPLDEDGEYGFEFSPFLDENGNPIPEDNEVQPEKPKKLRKKLSTTDDKE